MLGVRYTMGRFEDAATQGIPWRTALELVGSECGLTDVGGKPRDRRSRQIILRGRAVYKQAKALTKNLLGAV